MQLPHIPQVNIPRGGATTGDHVVSPLFYSYVSLVPIYL